MTGDFGDVDWRELVHGALAWLRDVPLQWATDNPLLAGMAVLLLYALVILIRWEPEPAAREREPASREREHLWRAHVDETIRAAARRVSALESRNRRETKMAKFVVIQQVRATSDKVLVRAYGDREEADDDARRLTESENGAFEIYQLVAITKLPVPTNVNVYDVEEDEDEDDEI